MTRPDTLIGTRAYVCSRLRNRRRYQLLSSLVVAARNLALVNANMYVTSMAFQTRHARISLRLARNYSASNFAPITFDYGKMEKHALPLDIFGEDYAYMREGGGSLLRYSFLRSSPKNPPRLSPSPTIPRRFLGLRWLPRGHR